MFNSNNLYFSYRILNVFFLLNYNMHSLRLSFFIYCIYYYYSCCFNFFVRPVSTFDFLKWKINENVCKNDYIIILVSESYGNWNIFFLIFWAYRSAAAIPKPTKKFENCTISPEMSWICMRWPNGIITPIGTKKPQEKP